MRFNDLALGVACAASGAGIIVTASQFPKMAGMAYGPAFFPVLIGAGLCLCAVTLVAAHVLSVRRGNPRQPLIRLPAWFADRAAVTHAVAVLAAVAGSALLAPLIGTIATLALVVGVLTLLLGGGAIAAGALAVAMPLALHGLFANVLRVPLPRGVVENLLF